MVWKIMYSLDDFSFLYEMIENSCKSFGMQIYPIWHQTIFPPFHLVIVEHSS